MKLAAVIVAGIVCVVLGEVLMVTWLGLGFLDVTGNFWLRGILPVATVVVVLQALLLWRVYRANVLRYGIAFALTYGTVNAIELALLLNPVADIVAYVATDLVMAALVLGVFNQLFWKQAPGEVPA